MMTKKDYTPTLSAPYAAYRSGASLSSALKHLGRAVADTAARLPIIRRLAHLYSLLLEETVTPRQTLRLLHAQLAGLCLLWPADIALSLRGMALAWAAAAIYQCRS